MSRTFVLVPVAGLGVCCGFPTGIALTPRKVGPLLSHRGLGLGGDRLMSIFRLLPGSRIIRGRGFRASFDVAL